MTEEQQDILALYGVPGIGAKTFSMLTGHFGSAGAVFAASDARLRELPRLQEKIVSNIRSFDRHSFIADQRKRVDACGAVMVVRGSDDYPVSLGEFATAPPVLFVRGDVSVLSKAGVGFVGTRQATAYGERMTRTLASDVARAGYVIVSGMAEGIDSFAHRASIDAGGLTTAVFGCGVDVIFPTRNSQLAREIAAHGCLVSHFPMGTQGMPGNFPARNSVIVGLSRCTVVVEAGTRSGALITAELTLKAHRPLFAVPGSADSPKSAGTNRLFAHGAKPATDAHHILETLGSRHSSVTSAPEPSTLPGGVAGKILRMVSNEAAHVEIIGEKLGLTASELLAELTMLELDGWVVQSGGMISRR